MRPQTTPPRKLVTPLRAADDPEALLAQAAALRDEAKALEQAMRSEQEAKMQKAMEQAFAKADVANNYNCLVCEVLGSIDYFILPSFTIVSDNTDSSRR